jgi:hypothetical protein
MSCAHDLPDNVAIAIRDARLPRLDDRGLMPLEDARAAVRGASEFRRGGGHMTAFGWVTGSDRLWAALLSLEDAAEFVREASRIRWSAHPRGRDNTAPVERYGDAILPWLATFVRPDGRLVNVPWCVQPCLLSIGASEAFELIWKVRAIDTDDIAAATGPVSEPPPSEPDDGADTLVIEWIYAHPEAGFPALARAAEADDPRAVIMLKSLAQCEPSAVFGFVSRALGHGRAAAIFAAIEAPTEVDEAAILAVLDAVAGTDDWPELCGGEPERAYHGLRLIAARARDGDGWGVLFERIEGEDEESARLQIYCYGTAVGAGAPSEAATAAGGAGGEGEGEGANEKGEGAALPLSARSPFDIEGVEVVGPAGPLVLKNAMIEARDLRPGWVTGRGVRSSRYSMRLRAYLAEHPGAFFGDAREAASALQIGEDFDIIVESTAFEHVIGRWEIPIEGLSAEEAREVGLLAASMRAPLAHDAPWRIQPSESPVFQSLARAIVARDGSLFRPGASNLDWRLHAVTRAPDDDIHEA